MRRPGTYLHKNQQTKRREQLRIARWVNNRNSATADTSEMDMISISELVTSKQICAKSCGKSAFSRRMRIESDLLKDFPGTSLNTTPYYSLPLHSRCKLTAAFG